MLKLFSNELQKNSYVIIFTNPPTMNEKIITSMIDLAIYKNCKIIIFIPIIDEYYRSKVDKLDFKPLIEFDKLLKSKWMSKFDEKITVYYISPTSYIIDMKRLLMEMKNH